MKLQFFLALTLILFSSSLLAQQGKQGNQGQGLATRLGLEPKDTAAFLTLFREYQTSKKANHKALRQALNGMAAKSDSEMPTILANVKDLMQKESDLNKNYLARFEAMLTPRQVLILLQSKMLNMKGQAGYNKNKVGGRGRGPGKGKRK